MINGSTGRAQFPAPRGAPGVGRIREIRTWTPAAGVIACWLLLMSGQVTAQSGQPLRAGGMEIFHGFIPAEIVLGHPAGHAERRMHDGVPAWGEQFHLIVSLFEQGSGKRILGAEIKATLYDARSPGKRLAGPQKRLESMQFAGAESYGNYFNMPGPGRYRVELEIRRPGAAEIVKLPIEYRHALVTVQP